MVKSSWVTPDETVDASDSTINFSQQSSVSEKKPSLPGYELGGKLGEGAFGSVYSSVQESTGQAVAVKVLTRVNSRFRDEVTRLSSVSEHPHIVTLLDAQLEHEPPYIVYPLLAGSLADEVPSKTSECKLEQVCSWFRELAQALEFIHGRGILHCDLKPANVLLGEKSFARLTDFGQAALEQEGTTRLGSFWYMPLKQTEGGVPHVSWDLYALGATVYSLLTGQPPRATEEARETLRSRSTVGEKVCEYQKALTESTLIPVQKLNPKVDKELAAIVHHCLDEKAGYSNASELLKDLDRRDKGLPLLSQPFSYRYWVERFMARHKLSVGVSLMATIILLSGLTWSSYEVYKARKARSALIVQHYERGLSQLQEGQASGLIWLLKAYELAPREEFRLALLDNLQEHRQIATPFLYKLRTATAPSPSGHWTIWRDPEANLAKNRVDLRDGSLSPLSPEIFGASREQKDRVRFRLDGVELEPFQGSGGPAVWSLRSSGSLQPSERAAALAIRVSPESVERAVRTNDGIEVRNQNDELVFSASRKNEVPVQPSFSLQGDLAVSWEGGGSTWYAPTGALVFDEPDYYTDLFGFSRDGKLLAGSDGVSRVRVWDRQGETVAEFPVSAPVNEIAFNAETSLLVCATRDGRISGFDLRTLEAAWPPIKLQKSARWLYIQDSGNIVTMSDVVTVWRTPDTLDRSLRELKELEAEVARRTGWLNDRPNSQIRMLTRHEYRQRFSQ